ncbi:hypothetical protein IOD16_15395 [Saccharothrix sp. 6-C]|uniref:hypothetical protein n=1 Tax=Saccharothrix sp. 6-C TaxID=2781735 RepID=UPI0019177099|nr:hypothetical protein [Saccharothrix sp. 6-C]QQQ79657.1 hypothetical protein IOD16_15395 [Saccharothrix sp. 6-C]
MKWWTGGAFAILACAVAVGCADEPGRSVSGQVTAGRPEGSADPAAPVEPGPTTGTRAGAPRSDTEPAPTARTREETELPGVPGSPVTYDVTIFYAFPPDEVRRKIEVQLAPQLPAHCRPDLCGITFEVEPREGGDCVTSTSPLTVYPGGVITIVLGAPCPGTTPSEASSEPPADPTADSTAESTPATTTGSGP